MRITGHGAFQGPPANAAEVQPARRTRIFAIREDVPFDLWFQNHLHNRQNSIEGRTLVIGTHLAGISMTTIGAVRYSYARLLSKPNCDQRWRELKEQWHGISLSARAMLSPETAIDRFLDFWKKPQNIRDYRHLTFHRYRE